MSNKTIEPVEGMMVQTVTNKAEYLIQTHKEMIDYVMKRISNNASWVLSFEEANVQIVDWVITKGNSFGMDGYTFQRFH